MRVWMMLTLVATLWGCTSFGESARQESFDATTQAYARAMQWSDFSSLPMFLPPAPSGVSFNPDSYRDFKITSYQPSRHQVSADGQSVRRTAAIGYVRLSQMAEQTITAQEEWIYSEDRKRWFLQSGWPILK